MKFIPQLNNLELEEELETVTSTFHKISPATEPSTPITETFFENCLYKFTLTTPQERLEANTNIEKQNQVRKVVIKIEKLVKTKEKKGIRSEQRRKEK